MLCCLAFLSSSALPVVAESSGVTDGKSAASSSSDSVVTIAPLQQDFGVAHLYTMSTNPPQCILENAPVESKVQLLFGGTHYTWIIWDVSALPPGTGIVDVEIEHELVPGASNHDGFFIQYRRSGIERLPLPECRDAEQEAWDGLLYREYVSDTLTTVCRIALGDSAVADLVDAIERRGFFSMWITPNLDIEDPLALGTVTIPGWSAGSPVLRITWDSEVAVESRSWGAIKSLIIRE